jgi:hypothetical protein
MSSSIKSRRSLLTSIDAPAGPRELDPIKPERFARWAGVSRAIGRAPEEVSLPSHHVIVALRDLTESGCTIQGAICLPPGEVLPIQITMPEGERVQLLMKSIHCHLTAPIHGQQQYVCGLEPVSERDAARLEAVEERYAKIGGHRRS